MVQATVGMLIGMLLMLLAVQCTLERGTAVCYSGGIEIYRGPYTAVNLLGSGIQIPVKGKFVHGYVLADCITGSSHD